VIGMGKRLIVNADDYGHSEGINRGILEAHHKGIVTSTSVMICSPGVEKALRHAMQVAPNLGLGLHLTLTDVDRPVLPPSEVPSLVNGEGRFYPLNEWFAHYPQFDNDEIARELNAQFERFAELAGRNPDHLDGHHHAVYRHPEAARILQLLSMQYDIPIRNVWSDVPDAEILGRLLDRVPDSARESALAEIQGILAFGPTLRSSTRFVDTFYDTTATLGDLLLILTTLPDDSVTEIMCHPGYADAALISGYTTMRETELEILTHPSVREVIKSEGIALITFGDLQ
jgi:predicted glycoside hydrolase/deacetylase ChbG (UPF0249 family)